jgi:hypothetical protein
MGSHDQWMSLVSCHSRRYVVSGPYQTRDIDASPVRPVVPAIACRSATTI